MRRIIDIKKADRIEAGEHVAVPQSGMGILLARKVVGTEKIDGGMYVEIATDNGIKHLVGKGDQIVVIF